MKIAAMPLLLLLLAGKVRGQSADGFDPNANNVVRQTIAVQPDGKILIGGDFTMLSPNGGVAVTRNRIARLNPDGTVDTAFNPNASGRVLSIAVQADGKVLAGGSFTSIGEQTRNDIARLNPDTLWLSMHSVSSNAIYNSQAGVDDAIEVKADDVILKTGQPAVTS